VLQFFEALTRFEWKLVTASVLVSMVLTGVCSAAFYLTRVLVLDRPAKHAIGPTNTRSPLYVSFGTELFALLFAVDLCIAIGLVEVWRLREFDAARTVYQVSAIIFMLLTGYCCWLALVYERFSYEAWLRFRGYGNHVPGWWSRVTALPSYCKWWMRATIVRWTISTVHLACIVKIARYDWLARIFPWLSV
jgi:hypothetical protein